MTKRENGTYNNNTIIIKNKKLRISKITLLNKANILR